MTEHSEDSAKILSELQSLRKELQAFHQQWARVNGVAGYSLKGSQAGAMKWSRTTKEEHSKTADRLRSALAVVFLAWPIIIALGRSGFLWFWSYMSYDDGLLVTILWIVVLGGLIVFARAYDDAETQPTSEGDSR
jgi:cytochrome bd-type quinol oxidase subunit 2